MRDFKSQRLAAAALAFMLMASVVLLNALGPSLMAAAEPSQACWETSVFLI